MEAVVAAKIAALFIVLVISVIFGNTPYWVLKRRQTPQGTRRRNLFIAIFNAFSGGVFLGTCLLHLMVEGREELEVAFSAYGVHIEYPLFEVLVAFGFFAITFIDFVAELCFHGSSSVILEDKKPKPPMAAVETSTIRAVLLLIALSFHTIFDGLAIGLQEQDADVWQVLVAISVHKGLVAFCLGHQLYQAYKERTKLAFILVQLFCLMSPIGIALGIIITSGNIDGGAQTMTSAVLQGIASGTFLYVTFFEILSTAFTHGQSIWNIVLASVGFAAMAAVKLLDSD
ncbi:hypothetical protein LOTGIDRAFT_128233 [Lottia gigantea]|uniref:Zinc/iron permease n=1 Tax=Lottia gigantea TaxID=225164 RepID=V4A113_LOTGI|nr:hypothetical protein LOTGIDRAFT_128233 [Lottia gigantea]ESO86976.1 hypothetical protein LOTGIDRAFT_128233 [Lottia gigantea]